MSRFFGNRVRTQVEDCRRGVTRNIGVFLLHRYADGFEDDKATALAAAVTNELFGQPPANGQGYEFLATNGPLVEVALQDVKHIPRICHVVSIFTHMLAGVVSSTGTVTPEMIKSWEKLDRMGILVPIEKLKIPDAPEDMWGVAKEFEQWVAENLPGSTASIMNQSIPNLRPNNGPLEYLTSHYDRAEPKVGFLVDSLPRLAQDLSGIAQSAAQDLIREHEFSGDTDAMLLTHCVFDLLLTSLFKEAQKYSGNNDLASLIVDSVLYEVTGCDPSSPTEVELICGETHNARGIHKFLLARKKWPHIGDPTAWAFGKEASTLQGGSGDISIILSVASFTVRVRVYAKWSVEYIFCGTVPTEEQKETLQASLIEQDRNLIEKLKKNEA